MKLILEIPIKHLKDFLPYCDGVYVRGANYSLIESRLRDNPDFEGKSFWLGRWEPITIPLAGIMCPTHVILTPFTPFASYLAEFAKLRNYISLSDAKWVGVWSGGKGQMSLLKQFADIVALPRNMFRSDVLSIDKNYHLLGFKNLDEIRVHKAPSLSTSVPIRAGIMGIDIHERERRPRVLPTFDLEVKMSSTQIDIALKNIEHIKNASKEVI